MSLQVEVIRLLSQQLIMLEAIHELMVQQTLKPQVAALPSKLLTSTDVKQLLKIESSTLYRLKRSGALVPHKFGTSNRYLEADVINAACTLRKMSNGIGKKVRK